MKDPDRIYKFENRVVEVYHDDDPTDPREWQEGGVMVCFHRRYRLGDKHDLREGDFDGWDALKEHLVKKYDAVDILPLCLYDHSGITISVGLGGGWDSGQVGFILLPRDTALEWFGDKLSAEELKELARSALLSEVETYDQFLTGDTWGFAMKTTHSTSDGITVDEESCWGFYGHDDLESGLLGNALGADASKAMLVNSRGEEMAVAS
jgi:hypothetical protein